MPFVKKCLDKIPPQVRDHHPQIRFMAAKRDSYYGKSTRAIDHLKKAHTLFKDRGDHGSAIKCLADLGAQYYYTGYIPEARALMEQILNQVDPQGPTHILLMTYLVFLAAVMGDIKESRAHQALAQRVARTYPEFQRRAARILITTSKTYRLYTTGDFHQSARLNHWLIQEATEADMAACLPLARYQSAATDHCLGRYESGIAHAKEGIQTASHIHLRDSQRGWIHLAWADNAMGLAQTEPDHWQGAEEHCRRGLKIFQGPDNRWGQAHAWNQLSRMALAQNQWDKAQDHLDTALGCIQNRGLDFPLAQIQLTQARLWVRQRAHTKALDLLESILPNLAPGPHFTALAKILALHCQTALGHAPSNDLEGQVEQILAPGRIPGWAPWVAHRISCLESMTPPRPPSSPGFQPPGLKIHLFGPFQLHVGNRKIQAEEWTHGKALVLFKYLATHMDKGYLPKDLLLEILWPGQDPAKTGKRFNVAASRLRKILEPSLRPKAPSSYLLRQR
ncbi:MAG: hypothetical protein MI749_11140, partial [Desulfovibrionales bacterium]|nr:hypothetical protein [Desulfovibrionales bacterium]